MTTTRRSLLQASLALPAAAMLPRAAGAAAPFEVGFIYVAPIGDAGWTYQHELGRKALVAALGDQVKTTYEENVPEEGADAERAIHKFATDGNKLIFTTSFGFMNPTVKVAKQFPKVKFAHCTGYKRAPNLATYSARFYEGRYLTGLIAGRMTKSNVIGYVAAFPIPEVVQGINAVTLAARSVNPNVVTKVVFVSTWFDPGKERAAADTLISQGADVIMHHTDSTAIVQAGEEKGVWSFGYDSDMAKFGPKSQLTAVTMVWDQVLHRQDQGRDRRHVEIGRRVGRPEDRHGQARAAERRGPGAGEGRGHRGDRQDFLGRADAVRGAGEGPEGRHEDRRGQVAERQGHTRHGLVRRGRAGQARLSFACMQPSG